MSLLAAPSGTRYSVDACLRAGSGCEPTSGSMKRTTAMATSLYRALPGRVARGGVLKWADAVTPRHSLRNTRTRVRSRAGAVLVDSRRSFHSSLSHLACGRGRVLPGAGHQPHGAIAGCMPGAKRTYPRRALWARRMCSSAGEPSRWAGMVQEARDAAGVRSVVNQWLAADEVAGAEPSAPAGHVTSDASALVAAAVRVGDNDAAVAVLQKLASTGVTPREVPVFDDCVGALLDRAEALSAFTDADLTQLGQDRGSALGSVAVAASRAIALWGTLAAGSAHHAALHGGASSVAITPPTPHVVLDVVELCVDSGRLPHAVQALQSALLPFYSTALGFSADPADFPVCHATDDHREVGERLRLAFIPPVGSPHRGAAGWMLDLMDACDAAGLVEGHEGQAGTPQAPTAGNVFAALSAACIASGDVASAHLLHARLARLPTVVLPRDYFHVLAAASTPADASAVLGDMHARDVPASLNTFRALLASAAAAGDADAALAVFTTACERLGEAAVFTSRPEEFLLPLVATQDVHAASLGGVRAVFNTLARHCAAQGGATETTEAEAAPHVDEAARLRPVFDSILWACVAHGSSTAVGAVASSMRRLGVHCSPGLLSAAAGARRVARIPAARRRPVNDPPFGGVSPLVAAGLAVRTAPARASSAGAGAGAGSGALAGRASPRTMTAEQWSATLRSLTGLVPDASTAADYEALLFAAAESEELRAAFLYFDKLELCLQEADEAAVAPVSAFTHLVAACVYANQPNRANLVYKYLSECGVSPDVTMLEALATANARAGAADAVEAYAAAAAELNMDSPAMRLAVCRCCGLGWRCSVARTCSRLLRCQAFEAHAEQRNVAKARKALRKAQVRVQTRACLCACALPWYV